MCAGHLEFAMNDVLCSEDVDARSEVAKAPPYKATPDAAELSLAVAVAFGTAWLWRGIWLCIDDILFPDSRWRSATASEAIDFCAQIRRGLVVAHQWRIARCVGGVRRVWPRG